MTASDPPYAGDLPYLQRLLPSPRLSGVSRLTLSRAMRQPTGISPLAERLTVDLSRLKGASEHDDILALLVDAEGYRLDEAATAKIDSIAKNALQQVERNLDLLRLPEDRALWIEFPDAVRHGKSMLMPGTGRPVTIGALVCTDRSDPNRMIVITAWDFEDLTTRHSYAVASLKLDRLADHAWLARNRYSAVNEEALLRILDLVEVTIPPGLQAEMQTLEEIDSPDGWKDAYEERAKGAAFDVTTEIPFVLAAMLAIRTEQASTSSLGIGRPKLVSLDGRKSSRWPWLKRSGLHRHGSKADPLLSLFEAA